MCLGYKKHATFSPYLKKYASIIFLFSYRVLANFNPKDKTVNEMKTIFSCVYKYIVYKFSVLIFFVYWRTVFTQYSRDEKLIVISLSAITLKGCDKSHFW